MIGDAKVGGNSRAEVGAATLVRRAARAGLAVLLLGASVSLKAEDTQPHTATSFFTPPALAPGSPAGSYALSGFETVDLYSGNLNVVLPLHTVAGRGEVRHTIALNLGRNWSMEKFYAPTTNNPDRYMYYLHPRPQALQTFTGPADMSYSPGFAFVRHGTRLDPLCTPPGEQLRWMSQSRVIFVTGDGTEHELFAGAERCDSYLFPPYPQQSPYRGFEFRSADGSGMVFNSEWAISDRPGQGDSAQLASGTLALRNGTQLRISGGRVSSMVDRNGNLLTFSYPAGDPGQGPSARPDRVEDNLGRVTTIRPIEDSTCRGEEIAFAGAGGKPRAVTVCRTPLGEALAGGELQTYGQLFPMLDPADFYNLDPNLIFNHQVVSSVTLPDGRAYRFQYTPYGRVARIELPTGGVIEYTYEPTQVTLFYAYLNQRVSQRRVLSSPQPGGSPTLQQVTDYAVVVLAPPARGTTIDVSTSGASGALTHTRHRFTGNSTIPTGGGFPALADAPGRELRIDTLDEVGGIVLTTENQWATTSGSPAVEHAPAIVRTTTTMREGSTQASRFTTFTYDAFNNQTASIEHGYNALPLRRKCTSYVTSSAYTNPQANLVSLPLRQAVYNGSEGDVGCTAPGVASTILEYDGAALTLRPDITGHEGESNTIRGNVTAVRRRLNSENRELVTAMIYDVAGNILREWSPEGQATSFFYHDRWGIAADTGLSGTNTYAYPTAMRNALNHTTFMRYDFDAGLPVQHWDANGVTTEVAYNDPLDRPTSVIRAANQPGHSGVSHTYNDDAYKITTTSDLNGFGDNLLRRSSYYDGLGRTVLVRQHNPEGDVDVDTEYDGLGRVARVSNPHLSGQPAQWTTTTYDAQSRPRLVTTPDNATTTSSYYLNVATVVDPADKIRSTVVDALGRVSKVIEGFDLSPLTQACTVQSATCYQYDALDNLTGVTQSPQVRTFAYDSLSRLRSATNPESGTTVYSYDDDGRLLQRTDARGAVTNYAYDEIGRLEERSYVPGPGVPPTQKAAFVYDRTTDFGIGRLWLAGTGASTTIVEQHDAFGRVTAQQQLTNGQIYLTARDYNRAGAPISELYPSAREIDTTYDTAGRIAGVTGTRPGAAASTFLAPGSTEYWPHGAARALRLGNSLWEHTEFNSRLQLESLALGTSNGDSGRLGIGYGYGGVANNGNVLTQSFSVGSGPAFGQTYGYDDRNRLGSASETREGQGGWTQTFGYDRFGNRRVEPDSLIPNSTLTPMFATDFNTATNRLVKAGSQYDAAGNLTADSAGRSYVYDAENRLVRFTAGSGSTLSIVDYSYDADGRRVKKVDNTGHVSVYVYDADGRLVTEHSNADPVRPGTDYVYAGPRLLAAVQGPLKLRLLRPLGPTGLVDNCAQNATFEFSWTDEPLHDQYRVKIDGTILGPFDASDVCSIVDEAPFCVMEPEAEPGFEPFKPGWHSWAVQIWENDQGLDWSDTQYYVIGPRPATPLTPRGALTAPPTTFTWEHSPDADSYTIYIRGNPIGSPWNPADICTEDLCTATPQPPPALDPGEEYSWRIHGLFLGQCEVSSLPLRFTFGTAGSSCVTTRLEPANNALWVEDGFAFKWTATPGATQYQFMLKEYPWEGVLTIIVPASVACQDGICSRTGAQLGLATALVEYLRFGWKVVPVGQGNPELCPYWIFTRKPPLQDVCSHSGDRCIDVCYSGAPCNAPCMIVVNASLQVPAYCGGAGLPCNAFALCFPSCESLGGSCMAYGEDCAPNAPLQGYTLDCSFNACCGTGNPPPPPPFCGDGDCNGTESCGTCPDCACADGLECTAQGVPGTCVVPPVPSPDMCQNSASLCSDVCMPGVPCDAPCRIMTPGGAVLAACGGAQVACSSTLRCTSCLTTMHGTCMPYGQACSSGNPLGQTADCGFGMCCSGGGGPACGNGTCSNGETCSSCPTDCGACPPPPPPPCGNGTCSAPGENCITCPVDCGACVETCGNGYCAFGVEDCSSCAQDCGPCPPPNPCTHSGEMCVNVCVPGMPCNAPCQIMTPGGAVLAACGGIPNSQCSSNTWCP